MKKTALIFSAAVYSVFSFIYINDMNLKKAENMVKQKKQDLKKIEALTDRIKNRVPAETTISTESFNSLISSSAVKYRIDDRNIRLSCRTVSKDKKKYTLQIRTGDLNKGLAWFMEIEKLSGRTIKNMNIKKSTKADNMYLSLRAEFVI
jgi:transcription initiation factor TFIID subunit TAF12